MLVLIGSLLLTLALSGCDERPPVPEVHAAAEKGGSVEKAVAVLHPTDGHTVAGAVTFSKSGDEVQLSGEVTGLSPGKHGFHVHEWGNCNCPDAKCAGDHFAAPGTPHGAPQDEKRHHGDLGNLEADSSGRARVSLTDDEIKLDGASSIVGRALIVHEKPDDLKTQPSGNAGGRLACGVIGIAGP